MHHYSVIAKVLCLVGLAEDVGGFHKFPDNTSLLVVGVIRFN